MSKELEEAIKILEKVKMAFAIDIQAPNVKVRNKAIVKVQAIETVLKALKNSIPKEVIKDKRNILEKQYKEALEENSTKAFILKCKIETLKELEENE